MGNHQARIRDALEQYRALKPAAAQALGGAMIHFTRAGFSHLLRKGRKARHPADYLRRIKLIHFIPSILEDSHAHVSYRFRKLPSGKLLEFWTLAALCDQQRIKIVITSADKGQKEFLSIMNE